MEVTAADLKMIVGSLLRLEAFCLDIAAPCWRRLLLPRYCGDKSALLEKTTKLPQSKAP